MIEPGYLFSCLRTAGVNFFAGVPDSLLKEFCAYVDAVLSPPHHLITANEGSAVAVAAGYHLATGQIPLVYLQNSGLGNMVNPLLSLNDPEVYGNPVILLIGWRGEPGIKDEPQHVKQGRVTPALLDAMEIPYRVLDPVQEDAEQLVSWAVETAAGRGGPVALLAREGVFSKSDLRREQPPHPYAMSRERAIECLIDALPAEATVISTTGKISRELYELRTRRAQDHASDFLTVGSMGHASQIALGISIAEPDKLVVCLDGDGAAIMHLGGLTSIGTIKPRRFVHIILNNGMHESVGGQQTVAFDVNLCDMAKAAGYETVQGPITEEEELAIAIEQMLMGRGPSFLEIRVAPGSRSDLGRPKETPKENKLLFVERMRQA